MSAQISKPAKRLLSAVLAGTPFWPVVAQTAMFFMFTGGTRHSITRAPPTCRPSALKSPSHSHRAAAWPRLRGCCSPAVHQAAGRVRSVQSAHPRSKFRWAHLHSGGAVQGEGVVTTSATPVCRGLRSLFAPFAWGTEGFKATPQLFFGNSQKPLPHSKQARRTSACARVEPARGQDASQTLFK